MRPNCVGKSQRAVGGIANSTADISYTDVLSHGLCAPCALITSRSFRADAGAKRAHSRQLKIDACFELFHALMIIPRLLRASSKLRVRRAMTPRDNISRTPSLFDDQASHQSTWSHHPHSSCERRHSIFHVPSPPNGSYEAD